jgi:uncharacterized membrane protein
MFYKKHAYWLLLFLIIGFLLRLHGLGERSLWTDEFFTFFQASGHGIDIKLLQDDLVSRHSVVLLKAGELKKYMRYSLEKSLRDIAECLRVTDTHPPLYFFIINIWMRLFGDSVFAVRFFSVIVGLFAIPLAYRLAQLLFNDEIALACSLFVCVSPFAVRYSQEARAYALLLVIGLYACVLTVKIWRLGRYIDVILLALVSACGIYVHYFYALIALAQFLYVTVMYRDRPRILDQYFLAFLWCLVLLIPWAVTLMLKGYNFLFAQWPFGYPGPLDKLWYALTGISRYILMFDVTDRLTANILALSASVAVLSLGIYKFRKFLKEHKESLVFCGCVFLVPLVIMCGLDILQHGVLLAQERFWMFPFIGFVPLGGCLLDSRNFKQRSINLLLVCCMVFSSIQAGSLNFGPAPARLSSWINAESKGRPAAVIVYNIRSVLFAQAYYLDNNAYIIAVSNPVQRADAVKASLKIADKIFIVRHYNRNDASLTNESFMETPVSSPGICVVSERHQDDIKVTEYARCAS